MIKLLELLAVLAFTLNATNAADRNVIETSGNITITPGSVVRVLPSTTLIISKSLKPYEKIVLEHGPNFKLKMPIDIRDEWRFVDNNTGTILDYKHNNFERFGEYIDLHCMNKIFTEVFRIC